MKLKLIYALIMALCFSQSSSALKLTVNLRSRATIPALHALESSLSRTPKEFPARDFYTTFKRFMILNSVQLNSHAKWLGDRPSFATKQSNEHVFKPFVQKKILPADSTVALFGDLHGNINSLYSILTQLHQDGYIDEHFRIQKSNFYMVFLGDYVDRGPAGLEVLHTIMQLKNINPQHVFLVRGNHEDAYLNKYFGFHDELNEKLHTLSPEEQTAIYNIYNMMPVALYIGTKNTRGSIDYVQLCHGGIEPGYNVHNLLAAPEPIQYEHITSIARSQAIRKLPGRLKKEVIARIPQHELCDAPITQPTSPVALGLMWHDFVCGDNATSVIDFQKGRGWMYGKDITKHFLRAQSDSEHVIHGIIRAHQHYGDMLKQLLAHQGIVNLWDGMVYTLLSAPFPGMPFNYTTYALLTTALSYSDWKITTIKV